MSAKPAISLRAIALLFSLCFAAGRPACAGPLRAVLQREAPAPADALTLARLVPDSVSPPVREHSARVPPKERTHDGSRLLNVQDVQQALARASNLPGFVAGSCSSLDIEASLPLVQKASSLLLLGAEYDQGLQRMRFRLRSGTDPKAPPFFVLCGPRRTAAARKSDANNDLGNAGSLDAPADSLGERSNDVDPRRMARLFLHSDNFSTILAVRPMQRASTGESIFVRVPANGRTLLARVAGPDSLEMTF